jgi:ubiquinone/menaquinone biosynthesis C-methylase UbiE
VAALMSYAGVRRGERLLHASGGDGLLVRAAAAAAGPTGVVVGCSPSAVLVTRARAASAAGGGAVGDAAPVLWVRAASAALPLPAEAVEKVLLGDDRSDPPGPWPAVLGEVARVLVPGGRLVLCGGGQPGLAELVSGAGMTVTRVDGPILVAHLLA